jgi:hypothetical protein
MEGFGTVTVARVNEGEHQSNRAGFDRVRSLSLEPDGTLRIETVDGQVTSLGHTTWGSFKVVRVASSEEWLG